MPTGRRVFRAVRLLALALPALLLVCALVLPWIPDATGLFSDSAGPWYQSVTALLFFAVLIYAYPVTLLCTRLVNDNMFFSPGYYVVLAIYTALWMILFRALFSFFERPLKKS
jgi:cytochrome c oxidase assembly factor CtaG